MKIDITLNGVTVKKDIPTSYQEMTYEHLIGLASCGEDKIKILSMFTDIPEETLRKAKINNLFVIIDSLKFLKKEVDQTLPKSIMGHSIKDIEIESIGQYADIQDIIAKYDKDDPIGILKSYPLIVATYCVKPYDFTKAEELSKELLKAPCSEVLAVANFTLVKLEELNRPTQPIFLRLVIRLSKLKRAMKNWLSRLVFTQRYYSWRNRLRTHEINYLDGR
jgi:hypothetical protein